MEVVSIERECPHADVRDCPLYHAAHVGGMGGCDDGRMIEGCAVNRTMSYPTEVARLRWKHREWWEEFLDHVAGRLSAEQRERNSKTR